MIGIVGYQKFYHNNLKLPLLFLKLEYNINYAIILQSEYFGNYTTFAFDKEESKHIIKVLRKKDTDILHVTNGVFI
jgi:hypothetical protein